MATKKHLHSGYGLPEDKPYVTPILIPNETGFDIKMCCMTFDKQEGNIGTCGYVSNREICNYTDELFLDAYQHLGSSTLLDMLDPYFRCKFTNPKIYEVLYFTQSGGYNDSSIGSEALRAFIRNVIVLDQGAISYIYNLLLHSCDADTARKQLHQFLTTNLQYRNINRNARIRLGISKNKEKLLKAFPHSFILKFENKLFDDDVDFLIEVIRTANNDSNALKRILNIKKANPKLKYEDIIRTAIFTNLNNSRHTSFTSGIYNLNTLVEMYDVMVKDMKYDRPFKMSTAIAQSTLEGYTPPENDCVVEVKDGYVYRLTSSWPIAYANAIADAYPTDYLEQSIMKQSGFHLIVKHGKYYLCETRDCIAINCRRNGKEAIIDIKCQKGI